MNELFIFILGYLANYLGKKILDWLFSKIIKAVVKQIKIIALKLLIKVLTKYLKK